MTVNIGLIGLGMIGRDHLQRFQTVIQNARVSAVCDINRNVTDTIAREYGAQPYYDAVEMIQSDDVDAIFICSIGPVHKEQILAAIKAGKPVFCEKPLTPTADEAKAIIDAEVAYGKRMLQLGFMRRFDPGYNQLKATLDSGELGEILLIHCAHRNASVPESYTPRWRLTIRRPTRSILSAICLTKISFRYASINHRRKRAEPARICRIR